MAKKAKAVDEERAKTPEGEADLRHHLAIYLAFAVFFFMLDVITGLGDWWFFWPVFFWGWAVVFHAVGVYGAAAPAKVIELLGSMVPGASRPRRAASRAPAARTVVGSTGGRPDPRATANVVEEAETRVARLWRVARRIPGETAREQAFRVCAAADRVAEVLAQDKDRIEPETARWFIDRLLSPTEALLDRYVRVASRGVASAEPTLAKVEREDLPAIESRLDTLYQQLHRGDVVDLAVASEMLEFGLDEAPPLPSRARSATATERGGGS